MKIVNAQKLYTEKAVQKWVSKEVTNLSTRGLDRLKPLKIIANFFVFA